MWENHETQGHRFTSNFQSFAVIWDESKCFFFLRITSEKAQTAVQKQKSSKYYLESPAAKRLISDMAEITFTSQSQQLRAGVPAEHSRSTHPDKSCYQVQEGDGNTVLALGLLHAHQKVSIAPSIHSLCTVKWARVHHMNSRILTRVGHVRCRDCTLAKSSY